MLFWIYIVIALIVSVIVVIELYDEKEFKKQIALALVLIPLLLRVFLIK